MLSLFASYTISIKFDIGYNAMNLILKRNKRRWQHQHVKLWLLTSLIKMLIK